MGPRPIAEGWECVTTQCAGVYAVLNWVTGLCYVGCAKKLRARMQQHRSDMTAGHSSNAGLRKELERMGAECFSIFPLQTVPRDHPRIDWELRSLEEDWIYAFSADIEGIGHNSAVKGRWTDGARFRDTERKYMRRRRYFLLDGVHLYDPIDHNVLSTWVPNFIRPE